MALAELRAIVAGTEGVIYVMACVLLGEEDHAVVVTLNYHRARRASVAAIILKR